MQYSSYLPKRNYETTIGYFDIVDITSYFTLDDENFEKIKIPVDKSQTLIEASYITYGDVDSFWLFLFANKKINPFTLTKFDSTYQLEKIKNYTALDMTEGSGLDVNTYNGSILIQKTSNSGVTWDYGSTGNFSLTGGFALVDSFNTFSKRVTIKDTKNSLPIGNNAGYFIINKSPSGSYSIYDASKNLEILDNIVLSNATKSIKYESTTTNRITSILESELPVIQKGSGAQYTPQGTGITFSTEEDIENQSIDIDIYDSKSINASNIIQVKQNYVV